jgi:hypothetical protein
VTLVDDEFDADECRRAMQAYCREVVMVPNPYGQGGHTKRLLHLRSLASPRSFERLRVTFPALQQTLDHVLRARRFDVVDLELPYLGHWRAARSPTSCPIWPRWRTFSWVHTVALRRCGPSASPRFCRSMSSAPWWTRSAAPRRLASAPVLSRTPSGCASTGERMQATAKQRNTEAEKKDIKEGRIPEDWKGKPAKLRQKDRDALDGQIFKIRSRPGTARSASIRRRGTRPGGVDPRPRSVRTTSPSHHLSRNRPEGNRGIWKRPNEFDVPGLAPDIFVGCFFSLRM